VQRMHAEHTTSSPHVRCERGARDVGTTYLHCALSVAARVADTDVQIALPLAVLFVGEFSLEDC